MANKLASRAYAIMNRMAEETPAPYQHRDLQGKPIPKQRAREIIQVAFPRTPVIEDQAPPQKKDGERLAQVLSTRPSEDASKKRATGPLPISDILKDIMP